MKSLVLGPTLDEVTGRKPGDLSRIKLPAHHQAWLDACPASESRVVFRDPQQPWIWHRQTVPFPDNSALESKLSGQLPISPDDSIRSIRSAHGE